MRWHTSACHSVRGVITWVGAADSKGCGVGHQALACTFSYTGQGRQASSNRIRRGMGARQALLLAVQCVQCIGCQRPCLMHMASPSCPASWLCFAATGANHSFLHLCGALRISKPLLRVTPCWLRAAQSIPPSTCVTAVQPLAPATLRALAASVTFLPSTPAARLLRMCPPLPGDQVVAQVLSSSGEVLSQGHWTAVIEAAQA